MTTAICEALTTHDGIVPGNDHGRRLRVCHVSLSLATGGLERLLVDFARFHDRSRFELTFLALHDLGRPAEDIRSAGCAVESLGAHEWGRLRRVRGLAKWFRELEPDVVHTHNTFAHIYGTAAARWAGVPVVVHTRHGQRLGKGRATHVQFRLASRWVDRVVAVSDDAVRLCRTEDRLPARKVDRIWNGIDLDRFRFRGPAARPVAISVARLSPEKDFPTLLRAAALVVKQVPEFRLRIVGGGPERPLLDSLVRELGLQECVELLGERSDVPDLLAKAGFFVTASLTEGVSLTLLEAMAVGLPILATAVGGNPEVVTDGVTGRLVPPGDPAVLAEGIVRMCRERDQWPALAEAGRQRVEEHFDIRRMLQNYEELYDELLATQRT